MPNGYEVAVFYFPGYHPEKMNNKWHGKGWSEWELLKRSEPRFKGHYQQRPLWGYDDESTPTAQGKRLKLAADYGVDVMLYDWYWYAESKGPYLNRPIDTGYMKAPSNKKIKFALLWAAHTWMHPNPFLRVCADAKLMKGSLKPKEFDKSCDYILKNYFSHPSYWRLDGKLFISVFSVSDLCEGLGGVKNFKKHFDKLRKKTRDNGLGEIHLNVINHGQLKTGNAVKDFNNFTKLMNESGFDSTGDYNWLTNKWAGPKNTYDYGRYEKTMMKLYEKVLPVFKDKFIPNITMGWDVSSRCASSDVYENLGFYPFTAILTGNTPAKFHTAFLDLKKIIEKHNLPKAMTVNAWNEWTEGSYLEPEKKYRFQYLKALKNAFE